MHKPFESYQEAHTAAEVIGLRVKDWNSYFDGVEHVVINPQGLAVAEIVGTPEGGFIFQWEDLRKK